MKLPDLKQHVQDAWQDLAEFNGAVLQERNFKPEIRSFGDLRYKTTWQKAYASFAARSAWFGGITEHTAICHVLNFIPDRWDYDLRHLILDEFLALPGAQDFLIRGLEQIYTGHSSTDQERAHEFLEVVSQQPRGTRRIPAVALGRFPAPDQTAAAG
ncbi:MAG: hypothetical protein HC824_14210 [Synechococcales cyanobacterium RM1_1_8]|nr:hypothetical protein [Synechococcales cyanobacterium RM1_1_8]